MIRPVQQVGIEIVSMKMRQRAFKGLSDLGRKSGIDVIRRSVILSIDRRKLCLHEECVAGNTVLPQAHECFSSHLVEYAFGRRRERLDDPLVSSLTDASLGGAPIIELLVRIAESPAFLSRSTEELP